MIADGVALVYHTADKLGRGAAVIVCDEENGLYAFFFEGVENARGKAVLIALIKCESDPAVRLEKIGIISGVFLLSPYRVDRAVFGVTFLTESPAYLLFTQGHASDV